MSGRNLTSGNEQRREWWLDRSDVMSDMRGREVTVFEAYLEPCYDDLIHVTELKPDEIATSRQRIEALFDKYGIVLKKQMLDELFGAEKETREG